MIRKRYIMASLAALLAVPAFVSAVAPSTESKFLNALAASKLQYPDSSTDADSAALLAGHDEVWFTLTDTDKMTFTHGTDTERSELRNLHNWNVNTTVQTAHANLAVISQAADQVTVMQIHDDANAGIGAGPNKPLIRIFRDASDGKIWAVIKDDATGATNLPNIDLGSMPLGTYFDCDITVDKGELTVAINGTPSASINGLDVSYWNFPSYWKAGLYLQDSGATEVRFNELTWPGAKAVVDDSFADVDRTNTGALQADWWSSSKENDDSIEVDANGLGLVTGGSGRGIHGTFTPQNLAIGETLTTTLSFTTPATVGADLSGGLKVALMDFNNVGLAADLLSESATSNPLYENLPGYYIEFDVNRALDNDDITIRKHNVPNAIGRFLGTSSEWASLGNSPDVGYGFDPNKDYTIILTVTRTGADTMDVSGILQDENGAVLDIHTEEDSSSIANHFGMVGVWANGNAFGSLNSHGVGADNGITITNAKVELVNLNYNQAPAFTFDPTVKADATQDSAYSGSLAGDASDFEGDSMTFSLVSVQDWLFVASDGTLSGTPDSGDLGLNTFTVEVADAGGSSQATLNITVVEASPVIVDDSFADLDRTKTGSLDADWWSTTSSSNNSVEVDANGLGLISGDSGRGLHGTFSPQTLSVNGTLTATLTFTTPTTVYNTDTSKTSSFKIAIMDLDDPGFEADLDDPNSLFHGQPGYMIDFDVNTGTTSDITIRKHDPLDTQGKFLGTTSEWDTIGSSGPDAGYTFSPNTTYTIVITLERTAADTLDISATLSEGAVQVASHMVTDPGAIGGSPDTVIANNFGMLGIWANKDIFGSTTASDPDNGLTFSNIKIEAEGAGVTNQAPEFSSDPIVEINATQDAAYSSSIADNASDLEGDTMTFSLVSAPDWLSVAPNGDLSGTPDSGDVGLNSFTVQVDATGGSDTATLNITVDAPFAGGTLVDDNFADDDLAATGTLDPLDADWWGTSGTSAREIDPGVLGLRSGTSGRGLHGTFAPQTLGVGDSMTATMSFTTPATVGSNKGASLKFALMDFNNSGLAADTTSSSESSNPLYEAIPGYMIDFDVNLSDDSDNIVIREHKNPNTTGRLLGTTDEWDELGSGPVVGYEFLANTNYVVVMTLTRTNTGIMDISASLSLASGGAPLASYTASDVDGTLANNFGYLAAWVNGNTFGSTNAGNTPDNGIDFTNIKVETAIDNSGNTPPTATGNSGSVDETALVGDDVLTVVASDDSAISSFEIIAGNTGDAFSIDSSGLIEVAASLDYATTPSYTLTIQVTDDGTPGLKDTATVTITVNEVVSGFGSWASGFSLVDDTETGDDDNDDIENVLEYILGGDPTVADLSILPDGATNGANYELTFTRSDDSENDATTTVQFGSDLAAFPTTTETVPAASGTVGSVTFTIVENGAGDDDVTASIPHGGATEFFGRVGGSLNP